MSNLKIELLCSECKNNIEEIYLDGQRTMWKLELNHVNIVSVSIGMKYLI